MEQKLCRDERVEGKEKDLKKRGSESRRTQRRGKKLCERLERRSKGLKEG